MGMLEDWVRAAGGDLSRVYAMYMQLLCAGVPLQLGFDVEVRRVVFFLLSFWRVVCLLSPWWLSRRRRLRSWWATTGCAFPTEFGLI